jgi:hypothetical protein
MSFQKIINSFDIYGYSPYFFVGGYKRSGSLIGLLSTITSIILGILISLYYINKLFNSKELTVITSEITPIGIDNINLTKDSFYFTFSLENPETYQSFIDENIYYPKVFYKYAIRDNEKGFIWNEKNLNFGPCELNDFGINYRNYFENYNLNQMYCLKNINESIKGIFHKNEYSFIFIQFFECKNTTNKKNCKSQEEINYFLDGTFVTISYQSLNINPKNYLNPNEPTISEFYTTISHNFFKEIHLYFKKVIIKTDRGLIFDDINNKEFSIFDHSEDMFSLKKDNEYFFEISVKFADRIKEYFRSYTKVQNVICNIGGFLKFIQGTFWFISYIFVENEVYQKIINKIFYIETHIMRADHKLIRFNSKNTNFPKEKVSIADTSLLQLNIRKKDHFKTSFVQAKNFDQDINLSNVSKNSMEQYKFKMSDKKIRNASANESKSIVKPFININNKSKINSISFIENMLKDTNSNRYSQTTSIRPLNSYKNKISMFFKNLNNAEIFKNKNKSITLNYCERLCLKMTKNKNKVLFYQKGIGLIEQKLDIISIIKDSFQLSLLKKMFFNREHIILMDNIIKIELSGQIFDQTINDIDNEQKENKNIISSYNLILNRFKKSYLKKNNFDQLDKMDYYFIQLLNEQFSNFK